MDETRGREQYYSTVTLTVWHSILEGRGGKGRGGEEKRRVGREGKGRGGERREGEERGGRGGERREGEERGGERREGERRRGEERGGEGKRREECQYTSLHLSKHFYLFTYSHFFPPPPPLLSSSLSPLPTSHSAPSSSINSLGTLSC